MKALLMVLFLSALSFGQATAPFARNKETPSYDMTGEGTFSLNESGHNDWVDKTSCHQEEGEWHCAGDWEAPTGVSKLCLLRTGDQTEVFLDCSDASNLGLFAKVKYHVVANQKTATAQLTNEKGKEWTLKVLRIRTEDPGVKKARIELCQQGILKGDRCAHIPPKK